MPLPLIAEIVPQGSTYALLDDSQLRGSFRIVNTLTERNNIVPDKRKAGMWVFVISTDTIYVLQNDLVTWAVNATASANLQAAYNAGAEITTASGVPLLLQGTDASMIFQITDHLGNPLLDVNGNGDVNVSQTLTGNIFTTSIECSANTNSSNIIIDTVDTTIYRAVHYFYTCANSDNSGFETGSVFLVQNGSSVSVCAMMNSSIGIPCGLSFGSAISGSNMELLVTTDNSGAFSRVLRLFKVALP